MNIGPPSDNISKKARMRELRTVTFAQNAVRRDGVVIAMEDDSKLDMLQPSTRLQVLVRVSVYLPPLVVGEGAGHETHVYEVELVGAQPRLGRIVYFEDTVWWNPWLAWREEIDTMDHHCKS